MDTTTEQSGAKLRRYLLGSLLLLMALNAFGGGFYAMAGAKDVPVEWLKGSPFPDYFLPGLFLFLVIGGSALIGAVAVFSRHRLARRAALFCGVLVLLWILIQVIIIGYVSWMQPATAVAAILILLLTLPLPRFDQ